MISSLKIFYPRSPCGERPKASQIAIDFVIFLSTLSLRRATKVAVVVPSGTLFFYPRSPCGERLEKVPADVYYQAFLSTLSLRRATSKTVRRIWRMLLFYPRSPCGERPWHLHCVFIFAGFSIHALLAESDERYRSAHLLTTVFLSTLSLRRATSRV